MAAFFEQVAAIGVAGSVADSVSFLVTEHYLLRNQASHFFHVFILKNIFVSQYTTSGPLSLCAQGRNPFRALDLGRSFELRCPKAFSDK
jgi:hypothetical protein